MPRHFANRQAKAPKHPPNYLRVDRGEADERRALARSYMTCPINLMHCRPLRQGSLGVWPRERVARG
jgi:hypothetical protein